jgi:hypothetical protein
MASKKEVWEGPLEECVDMLAMCGMLAKGVEVKVEGVEVERRDEDVSRSRCRADVERVRASRDNEGRRDCICIARRPTRIQQSAMSKEEDSLDCGIIEHYLR